MLYDPDDAVLRGFAALQQGEPGWFLHDGPRSIDLATLDMASDGFHLLAQRFGTVSKGLAHLGIPEDEAAAYGFTGDPADRTSAWLIIIGGLRVAVAPAAYGPTF